MFPDEPEIGSNTKARPPQGLDGGTPLPTALTAPVVLGREGAGIRDLERCPRDRPASGRFWQLSIRQAWRQRRANETSSRVHCGYPGKPGTEFGKPGAPRGPSLL